MKIRMLCVAAAVAATIASLLGLEQPQVWVGRPMTQVIEER